MSNSLKSSGVTGGGRLPPETFDREISANLPGKNRQGKKGKGVKINWEEKKENRKRGGGKFENRRWKIYKMMRGPFFFFFFFFFTSHLIFKTTKICFGSTKMEIFYGEQAFHAGIKIRKNDFFTITPLLKRYRPTNSNASIVHPMHAHIHQHASTFIWTTLLNEKIEISVYGIA